MGDKIGGLTEEVKGKMLKKPEVAQHGHDRRTGELKKKQQDQAVRLTLQFSFSPFLIFHNHTRQLNAYIVPPHVSQDASPFADQHAGEGERAATVAPGGTEKGEQQKVQGGEGKTKVI